VISRDKIPKIDIQNCIRFLGIKKQFSWSVYISRSESNNLLIWNHSSMGN